MPDTRPAPPAPCGMPSFEPLRVRGGGRLRRALRRQRRAVAAGFALSSAVLAVSGLGGSGLGAGGAGPPTDGGAAVAGDARPVSRQEQSPGPLVSAPVRITDAGAVSLLRPGDRVDVLATRDGAAKARVVARDVRVTHVPVGRPDGTDGPLPDPGFAEPDGGPGAGGGALVVLAVERETAAVLAGAGASGPLAVAVSRGH